MGCGLTASLALVLLGVSPPLPDAERQIRWQARLDAATPELLLLGGARLERGALVLSGNTVMHEIAADGAAAVWADLVVEDAHRSGSRTSLALFQPGTGPDEAVIWELVLIQRLIGGRSSAQAALVHRPVSQSAPPTILAQIDVPDGHVSARWTFRFVWGLLSAHRDGELVLEAYAGQRFRRLSSAGLAHDGPPLRAPGFGTVTVIAPPDPARVNRVWQRAVSTEDWESFVELAGQVWRERADLEAADPVGAAHLHHLIQARIASKGFPDFALPQAGAALELRQRTCGARHPLVADAGVEVAKNLVALGRGQDALVGLQGALSIYEGVPGTQPERIGHVHIELGNATRMLGRLADAEAHYGEALRLLETNATTHQRADIHHNLGAVAWMRGDLRRALTQLERALELYEEGEAAGRAPPVLRTGRATTLSSLALVYRDMGDPAAALISARQSVELFRDTGSPQGVFALGAMSLILADMGRLDGAERALRQAMSIIDSTLGATHPYAATSRNNLAEILAAKGDLEGAREESRRALALREHLLGAEHPDVADSHHNLGHLELKLGDTEAARAHFESALQLYREQPKGRRLALAIRGLGDVARTRGELDAARAAYAESHALELAAAQDLLPVLSEAEALLYVQSAWWGRDELLSLLESDRAANAAEAHRIVWEGRALATRMLVARRQHGALSPQTAATRARLQEVRRLLAHGVLSGGAGEASPELLRSLSAEKERLERRLAAHSGEAERVETASVEELLSRLTDDTALVEIVARFRALPKGADVEWEEVYDAFILRPGSPSKVIWLSLGDREEIDAAVSSFRRAIAQPAPRSRGIAAVRTVAGQGDLASGRKLRERLWAPIETHLGDARVVVVVPEAALTRVPWSALPGRQPGATLLDERSLVLVSHGQALTELLAEPGVQRKEMLVVGGVSYDERPVDGEPSGGRPTVRGLIGSTRWAPLPGTEAEALEVAAIHADRGGRIRRLAGAAASEAALRQALPRAAIAHLATHGFFAGDDVPSGLVQQRAAHDIVRNWQGGRPPELLAARNPLVLSGLVLAGANHAGASGGGPLGDDGVLSGEELIDLDLSGLELVVLSACETGLGTVAGGEGSFGLQRAFQLAGARTSIASLWQVDDAATRALMVELHRNLCAGLPKIEALRQAQRTLRDHYRPERGRARDASGALLPRRAQPLHAYYWSGFVLSGAWAEPVECRARAS